MEGAFTTKWIPHAEWLTSNHGYHTYLQWIRISTKLRELCSIHEDVMKPSTDARYGGFTGTPNDVSFNSFNGILTREVQHMCPGIAITLSDTVWYKNHIHHILDYLTGFEGVRNVLKDVPVHRAWNDTPFIVELSGVNPPVTHIRMQCTRYTPVGDNDDRILIQYHMGIHRTLLSKLHSWARASKSTSVKTNRDTQVMSASLQLHLRCAERTLQQFPTRTSWLVSTPLPRMRQLLRSYGVLLQPHDVEATYHAFRAISATTTTTPSGLHRLLTDLNNGHSDAPFVWLRLQDFIAQLSNNNHSLSRRPITYTYS
jgi:hypothetical protein